MKIKITWASDMSKTEIREFKDWNEAIPELFKIHQQLILFGSQFDGPKVTVYDGYVE